MRCYTSNQTFTCKLCNKSFDTKDIIDGLIFTTKCCTEKIHVMCYKKRQKQKFLFETILNKNKFCPICN